MTLLIINKGNYRHQNGKRYKPGEHVRRVIRPALRGHLARPTQLANERQQSQLGPTVQHSETVNCELPIGHTWNPLWGHQRLPHLPQLPAIRLVGAISNKYRY